MKRLSLIHIYKEVLPAPYFSIIENRTITDFKDKIFNPVFIFEENIAKELPDNIVTMHDLSLIHI